MKNYLIRDLPQELWKALKMKAVEDETTMRELILRYIEKGLKSEVKRGKS